MINFAFTYEARDKAEALRWFRKALEINPASNPAKAGLKRLGVTP